MRLGMDGDSHAAAMGGDGRAHTGLKHSVCARKVSLVARHRSMQHLGWGGEGVSWQAVGRIVRGPSYSTSSASPPQQNCHLGL